MTRFPWLDAPRPESVAESLRLAPSNSACSAGQSLTDLGGTRRRLAGPPAARPAAGRGPAPRLCRPGVRWPRRCSPSATRSSASSTRARPSAPPRRPFPTCSTASRHWRRSSDRPARRAARAAPSRRRARRAGGAGPTRAALTRANDRAHPEPVRGRSASAVRVRGVPRPARAAARAGQYAGVDGRRPRGTARADQRRDRARAVRVRRRRRGRGGFVRPRWRRASSASGCPPNASRHGSR